MEEYSEYTGRIEDDSQSEMLETENHFWVMMRSRYDTWVMEKNGENYYWS